MVEFSLGKRGMGNWTRGSSSKKEGPDDSSRAFKSSRYQDMKVSAQELPQVSAQERTKAGTMMKRRLSIHQTNFAPVRVDYENMPALPQTNSHDYSFAAGTDDSSAVNRNSPAYDERIPPRNTSLHPSAKNATAKNVYNSQSLRRILSDPQFRAKKFITERLGDATAVEIDQFTSNLNDLSLEIQDEIKSNINTSYKEVLMVNRELENASYELKSLRIKVQELKDVMNQFASLAEKRLQTEADISETPDLSRNPSSASSTSNSLLPPLKSNNLPRKDRSSVLILERMWNEELMTLFKNVEGAHKYIALTPGRHILLESSNWIEINPATLKPLQKVHLFILNDVVLVASSKQSKQTDLVVSKFSPLRDVLVTVQSENVLSFTFSNKQHTLYRSRDFSECNKVIDTVRLAKDALREISQAEEDNSRKIRDSFTLLQSERTPNREATTSPVKVHSRQRSQGANNTTPGRHRLDAQNDVLLTNITRSIHIRSGSRDTTEVSDKLRRLDDALEDLDLEIGRLHFDNAIKKLNHITTSLKSLYDSANIDEEMMVELLSLKCSQRRNVLYSKLINLLSAETNDMSRLKGYMLNLVALNEAVEAFEVFLQNRSNFINDLILQIGIIDNVTSYITQIAIIRFQTLKKVVAQYLEVTNSLKRDYTSILVCWCSTEVDKHFELMERELSNSSTLSVQSIKITRKQIDELKVVGMDYVYKLDDFIKKNTNRIQ